MRISICFILDLRNETRALALSHMSWKFAYVVLKREFVESICFIRMRDIESNHVTETFAFSMIT